MWYFRVPRCKELLIERLLWAIKDITLSQPATTYLRTLIYSVCQRFLVIVQPYYQSLIFQEFRSGGPWIVQQSNSWNLQTDDISCLGSCNHAQAKPTHLPINALIRCIWMLQSPTVQGSSQSIFASSPLPLPDSLVLIHLGSRFMLEITWLKPSSPNAGLGRCQCFSRAEWSISMRAASLPLPLSFLFFFLFLQINWCRQLATE